MHVLHQQGNEILVLTCSRTPHAAGWTEQAPLHISQQWVTRSLCCSPKRRTSCFATRTPCKQATRLPSIGPHAQARCYPAARPPFDPHVLAPGALHQVAQPPLPVAPRLDHHHKGAARTRTRTPAGTSTGAGAFLQATQCAAAALLAAAVRHHRVGVPLPGGHAGDLGLRGTAHRALDGMREGGPGQVDMRR